MLKEVVFTIRSLGTSKKQYGNCFIDASGYAHTAAHILEDNPKVAKKSEGGIVMDKYITYGSPFTHLPDKDYAFSDDEIGSTFNVPKIQFATRRPGGFFPVTIVSVYPYFHKRPAMASITKDPRKLELDNETILLAVSDLFVDGSSGSLISWEEPGVFGASVQRKTESRILGVLTEKGPVIVYNFSEPDLNYAAATGIAEICPQVDM